MKYHQNRELTNNRLIIGTTIAILIVSGYLFWANLEGFLKESIFGAANIAWSLRDNVAAFTDDFAINLKTKKSLEEENGRLVDKIKDLEGQLFSAAIVRSENENLRNLLSEKNTGSTTPTKSRGLRGRIMAPVVSGSIFFPYDSLVLDVGKS
ncbi:MAG: hypothetical protein WC797_03580, partial [Candidatus Paceibacterota bacterium]